MPVILLVCPSFCFIISFHSVDTKGMEEDTRNEVPLELKGDDRKDSGTPQDQLNPYSGLNEYTFGACLLRFVGTAFLGMFIDIVIFCLSALAVFMGCRISTIGLYYTLIEVPLICGILGIFFFDEMFDVAAEAARKIPRFGR